MHSAAKAAENWSGAGPICAFPWLALTLQCPPPGTGFSELLKGSPLETKLLPFLSGEALLTQQNTGRGADVSVRGSQNNL